jgi:hypothetical protein
LREELDAIIAELEVLVSSAEEDFKKKFWANYEKYLGQYNKILQELQQKGLFRNLAPINPVPPGDKAYMHYGFSAEEQAKLREIVNASKILLRTMKIPMEKERDETVLQRVERICSRFHLISRQLQKRHNDRKTLTVEDEYDVQDLMHALLIIDFDDIRTEQWTPSYAGGSARMDFILKKEQIVIETKKTREGLDADELGKQLIVDIEKYQKHPDCKILVCFVYDPEGRVKNPRGVETDLESTHKDVTLRVLIRPTGE